METEVARTRIDAKHVATAALYMLEDKPQPGPVHRTKFDRLFQWASLIAAFQWIGVRYPIEAASTKGSRA